jgi:hypothetical protein
MLVANDLLENYVDTELKDTNLDNDTSNTIIPGRWHCLPLDITDKILNYIGDVDMFGYLYQLSKLSIFRPTEECFRRLCEIIYLGQTSKGKLKIENWKSWKSMIIHRPRLRVNGFYCLRTLYSRAPNNDNFWEPKRTQSVEVSLYLNVSFIFLGNFICIL